MSEQDEAKEEDTTVAASPTDDAEDEFHPFDETSDSFTPSVIKKVTGSDGLPTQTAPPGTGMSDIPPLSTTTLVCMGDFSSFVVRDGWGDIVQTFSPDVVRQDAEGIWWANPSADKSSVNGVEVTPIRPPCKHYVRQITQYDKDPSRKDHLRLCSARRTTEGTFMTVKDSAMWACSMRVPRDPISERLIQEFDEKKVLEGSSRTMYSIKGNKQ